MNREARSWIILVVLLSLPLCVFGQSASDIEERIESHHEQIANLEKEIAGYQKQLNVLNAESQTLANAIKSLDISRAQITARINLTQNKIADANLTLKQLSSDISDKEASISLERDAIASSLRGVNTLDDIPLIATVFSSETLGSAWTAIDADMALVTALRAHTQELMSVKQDLSERQAQVEETKKELSALKDDLVGQQKSLDVSKQAKASLLAQTKSQESSYQALIAQKRAQQAAFEAELFQFESQLKNLSNPNSIPQGKPGILAWPVANVYITQYFGKTVAAQRLYVSGTHGGVDFGVSIGTPIYAAGSGEVFATEPSKFKAGCQYGKWVLIKHPNGLATIYGHLSLVTVSPGSKVSVGQVIGYSGDTGYATGPHLHFGVYQAEALKVVDSSALGSKNCSGIRTVASPPSGYIDPMIYLPG